MKKRTMALVGPCMAAGLISGCQGGRQLTILGMDLPDDVDFISAVIQSSTGEFRGSGFVPVEDGVAFQEHPDRDFGNRVHLLAYTRDDLEIPSDIGLDQLISTPVTKREADDPPLPRPSAYLTGPIVDDKAVVSSSTELPPDFTVGWLPRCEHVVPSGEQAFVEGRCPVVCTTLATQRSCDLDLSGQPDGSCFASELSVSLVRELETDRSDVLSDCVSESAVEGESFAFSCVRRDNETRETCRFGVWDKDAIDDPFEVDQLVLFDVDRTEEVPVLLRASNISTPIVTEDGLIALVLHPDPDAVFPGCYDSGDTGSEIVFVDPESLTVVRRVPAPPCTYDLTTRADGTGLFGVQTGPGPDRYLHSFDASGVSTATVSVPARLPFSPLRIVTVGDHLLVGYAGTQDAVKRVWPIEFYDARTLEHLGSFEYLDGDLGTLIPDGDELVVTDPHLDAVRVLRYDATQNTYVIQEDQNADLKFACVTIRPTYALRGPSNGQWIVSESSGSGSVLLFNPRADPSCVQRPFFGFPGLPQALLPHPDDPTAKMVVSVVDPRGPAALGLFQVTPPRFLPAFSQIGIGVPSAMVMDAQRNVFLVLRSEGTLVRARFRP